MPAISKYSPTRDVYLDSILGGSKWASQTLTFSFPTNPAFYGKGYGSGEPSANFEPFNPVQQTATRSTLKMYSSVANLKFTEVTETPNQHATLRLAESDKPKTAWAYTPNTAAAGGDAWFNNSKNYYDNPIRGNYAWLTIIHELGHALGLKHPHQASGSFGVMPPAYDSLEYTVMSYHSYAGSPLAGYTNETWSYPQSPMMFDIAAVQTLYGANYTTNSSATVYTWAPNTGEMFINGVGQGAPGGNKIFVTVWDGGGNDTYDLSNYTTDLKASLQASKWSTVSTEQLANLGQGHFAAGNIANALLYKNNPASLIENVVGGSGNDTLVGNRADNTITGGPGDDAINGQGGRNTAVYSGPSTDYAYTETADGSWTVTDLRAGSPDGTDSLQNIRLLKFSDTVVAIGPENAAPVAPNDSYTTSQNKKLVVGGARRERQRQRCGRRRVVGHLG